jgi:hypothetical protein
VRYDPYMGRSAPKGRLKRRLCYLPSATGFPSGPFLSDILFGTADARHGAPPVTSLCKLLRFEPRLRLLVSGLSPRRPRFNLRLMHFQFVVDKVALEQACYQLHRSSPICVIQHTLQTYSTI